MKRVTLAEALASGDLEPFIRQAEADGVGPADETAFEKAIEALVTAPQPEDRT